MTPKAALGAEDVATVMAAFRDVLRCHEEAINRLNVYPVPDGDTGTNMALTMESVVAELEKLGSGPAMEAVCRAVAHGSLMGARGNSGVILSQLLRGLAGVLGHVEQAGPADWAKALRSASDLARQAVLRPVEGTILTVAAAAADGAEAGGEPLDAMLEAALDAAATALRHTPEQLPALAQAGVVDAGGAGYLLLLHAARHVVGGHLLPAAPEVPVGGVAAETMAFGASEEAVSDGPTALRYEVMYLLDAADETIGAFKEVWAGIGDSIVVVGGDGLWNCHIHTDDIGAAIEAALDAGRPRDIRVTDLLEQVEEERWVREGAGAPPSAGPEPEVPRTAVVAVANGEGVGRIFRSLGVRYLVPGGQSMNPSTAQILEVIERIPAPEIVLLPNNENVIPVANQVCAMARKPVQVVPTGGIVEGFAALLEYDPGADARTNSEAMASSARRVVAGEVTQAVRDAKVSAGEVAAGDWLGLSRDGIEVVANSVVDALCGLLDHLLDPHHELVTLIEGDGARAADTRRVQAWLEEHHGDVAVEVHHGGQPLYPYLLSIE